MSPLRPLDSLQRRLAAWADSRLLPVGVVVLLVLDFAAGLNWLLSPPENLTAPAYAVAKQIAPMDLYGLAFMGVAVVAAAVSGTLGRHWWSGWCVGGLLSGLWAYWTAVLTLAPLGMPGASFAGALFAACFCCLHVLFGLALAHTPTERRPDRS